MAANKDTALELILIYERMLIALMQASGGLKVSALATGALGIQSKYMQSNPGSEIGAELERTRAAISALKNFNTYAVARRS